MDFYDDIDEELGEDTPDLGDIELDELERSEFEEIFHSDTTSTQLEGHKRTGNERLGKPILGKLAKARLIAARAGQLQLGATTTLSPEDFDQCRKEENCIAQRELEKKVIPIEIIKKYPDGTYEVWDINDFKYIW